MWFMVCSLSLSAVPVCESEQHQLFNRVHPDGSCTWVQLYSKNIYYLTCEVYKITLIELDTRRLLLAELCNLLDKYTVFKYFWFKLYLIIYSAVKLLIAINHIQKKSFCLHMFVYCVYLLFIYKYTHIQYICMYTCMCICICMCMCIYIYIYIYIIYIHIPGLEIATILVAYAPEM